MTRMAVIVLILGVFLPEMLLAGVVLEAGEVDSSKVRVGAFAEVVYGKGKRDPVSGEWEKLARVSGYIKAVDAERLTLALKEGLGKKQIAFARIQKLLLAASSYEMARLKKMLSVRAESSGMVLEAGEIDSSKVRVGAFAEVVYGKGARDPVSGAWEKLDTASGYIKAVDAEGLTLGRGLWKEQITFARIQRLILAESSREMDRLRKTIDTRSLSAEGRIGLKLATGAAAAFGLGLLGGKLGENFGEDNCGDEEGELCIEEEVAWGVLYGYLAGVSVGVSIVDPHDRFIASLGGSLIGFGVGVILTVQQDDLWPSLLICPVVGATAMSELTRKSPEARRLSVGLAPDPNGSVSAVATLRF